jgi:hypothetical protein
MTRKDLPISGVMVARMPMTKACQTFRRASDAKLLGIDVSEESMDKLEVECGHCGRLIRIRSLAVHILSTHTGAMV